MEFSINNKLHKTKYQCLYFYHSHRWYLIIIGILIIGTMLKMSRTPIENLGQGFSNWIDPLVGIFTFLIALGLWLSSIKKDWEAHLNKKMTVDYLFEGKTVMRCEEVNLSSEGDIRSLALQVGAQMTNNSRLAIEPYYEEKAPTIEWDEQKGNYFKHFRILFYLRAFPEKGIGVSTDGMKSAYHLTTQVEEEGVIIWRRR